MGGGGGSKIPKFKAQGNPPSFDYQSPEGLQQLAVGADMQGYALSDKDFANRYPALQNAYDTWQANLGQQAGQVAQGYQGQQDIMSGLANQIAGRQGTQTTGDINAMRNQAATAAGAVGSMYGLGGAQAGLAAPIAQYGAQQAGLAGGLVGMGQRQAGIGNQINRLGAQLAGNANIPLQTGLQLLNEPIDPMTQQQMQKAGLSSAAGALGAASLGQGMAGQAAAARQLGLNTLQYGQAMRGEAMQDINQYGSMLGAAGQMKGLGASTIGQGGQTVGLGGQQLAQGAQTTGLAGSQLQGAAGTYGAGAQTALGAGNLYGGAQGAQEQYATDTANMANIYSNMQNQQAANLLGSVANAGQMFQKRPFGLGGANLAQSELGQANAYNSFNQANYATMNGIAWNNAQLGAQQAQMNAANQSGMMTAGIGAAGSIAAAGATAASFSCWVARAIYPDNRWRIFRHWLMNKAPTGLRRIYMRHGQAFSEVVKRNVYVRVLVRLLMDQVVERTTYVYT